MVKTDFIPSDDSYRFPDDQPDIEYQSWARRYPTYLDLIQSVIAEPEMVDAA